jgi:hypothetical protein
MNSLSNYAEAMGYDYTISYDISSDGNKKYIGFNTKYEAIDYINNSTKNNYYEVIKDGHDVLLYFDKDNIKMTDNEFLEDYEKLRELIPLFMSNTQDDGDNKLTRGSFDIYTKRDNDGLIVSAHYISNEFYTNQQQNKRLCEELNTLGLGFDNSVYSKNRLFCINGNCKFGKEVVFEYDKLNYNDYECDKYVSWFDKNDYEEINFSFEELSIMTTEDTDESKENIMFNKQNIKDYLLECDDKLWGSSSLWKAVLNYLKLNKLMSKEEFCKMSITQHNGNNRKKYNYDKNINCWNLSRGITSEYHIINILNKCNDKYNYINQIEYNITDDEWEFINNMFNLTDDYKKNINNQINDYFLKLSQKEKVNNKYKYEYKDFYIDIKNGYMNYNNIASNLFLEYGNRTTFGLEKMEFDVICNTQDELINAVYEDEESKCILMNGKWGAGKTKALDKIINDKKTGIICISENNSLNGELKHRLSREGIKFISHLELKERNTKKTKKEYNYIISLESIHLIDEVEYLILDELVSIIQHFNSTLTMEKYNKDSLTHTPLLDKYIKLIEIINKAKKVFCMDADITEEIKTILNNMFNTQPLMKSYNLLQHNYSEYKFNLYTDKPNMEKTIIDELKNGLNIVLVCNKSKYCSAYEKLYTNDAKSVLKITKDELTFIKDGNIVFTNDKERDITDFVNDIDNKINELKPQILIYSPKLSTGISINTIWTDKLYCISDNNSVSPRTLVQMIFRVRTLLHKEISFYLECAIHRPKIAFTINECYNMLLSNKHQLEAYNKLTLDLLTNYEDVNELKNKQLEQDYNNDNKKIDNDYIHFRTYNLQEKLMTLHLFTQQFFKIFCINHGFRLNYIDTIQPIDYKSGFGVKLKEIQSERAIKYSKIDLINPTQYVEYKELMKTNEWKTKSSYEKSKIEEEIKKFNDLVKININSGSYKSYGLFQYDTLCIIYESINNDIKWIDDFLKKRQQIIKTQIRYFTDNSITERSKDFTSEKVNTKLLFNRTNELLKQYDLSIGESKVYEVNCFNTIIKKHIKWYNDNLLVEYNKQHRIKIEEFNQSHTKQIFKLIADELISFFKIRKSVNSKEVYIDTYKYIDYSVKRETYGEYNPKINDYTPKFKEEFKRIEEYVPQSYIVDTENNHKKKQEASIAWFKNLVGLINHNMKQDVIIGHNEQIVSNEHDEKIKDPASRFRPKYTNKFNNKKLLLQKNTNDNDDESYREYIPTLNKNILNLKTRISDCITEDEYKSYLDCLNIFKIVKEHKSSLEENIPIEIIEEHRDALKKDIPIDIIRIQKYAIKKDLYSKNRVYNIFEEPKKEIIVC